MLCGPFCVPINCIRHDKIENRALHRRTRICLTRHLTPTVLNVYKPRGTTPYGWRKQQEQRKMSLPLK